jgi:hypothetical protein
VSAPYWDYVFGISLPARASRREPSEKVIRATKPRSVVARSVTHVQAGRRSSVTLPRLSVGGEPVRFPGSCRFAFDVVWGPHGPGVGPRFRHCSV